MLFYHGDPERLSIMSHLAAVASNITNPETAIQRVSKQHGVDPRSAILALRGWPGMEKSKTRRT